MHGERTLQMSSIGLVKLVGAGGGNKKEKENTHGSVQKKKSKQA